MYLMQLFLLDNITIHLGFLLELRNSLSLGKCWRKEGCNYLISDLYDVHSCVPSLTSSPKQVFPHGLDCKFMPSQLQWLDTRFAGLCLETQSIGLSDSHCMCDFISKAPGERWRTVKLKVKFLRTLRQLYFALPLNFSVFWMYTV